MESNIIKAQQLIVNDFQLEKPPAQYSDLEKLQNWLAEEVSLMIDQDFHRLLNILYRIDVSETKVKSAFAGENPSYDIAGLIIHRELMKVETRKKYRN